MYVVATVEHNGIIWTGESECQFCAGTRVHEAGCGSDARLASIVHKESVGVHTWGGTCYTTLVAAKKAWNAGETVLLALDKTGACNAIWMSDAQRPLLLPRLERWKGCYGLWPIRKLNG